MCKIRVSIDECGVLYDGIDVMRSDPIVNFVEENDTQKECFYKLNYTDICAKRCPHFDCSIDHYKPVILHKSNRKLPKYPGTLLQIQIPTEPETSYSHKPRIELVEFICYLASTFNMWFGFSIYSLYNLFTIFGKRVKIKMNKTRRNVKDSLFDKKIISQKLGEVGSNDQVKI